MTHESHANRTSNHLEDATSPYLLQHAQNPVDWYPWSDEAFAKASAEDKPVFLSIGYAACHWCHVMEHESFENEEIAQILNDHFVSIKVDREQRPDVDEIYMTATMILNNGQGGWPMSVFLTPADRKPFFAGTYFPPESRMGMPGFRELLLQIVEIWNNERQRIDQSAGAISDALQQISQPKTARAAMADDIVIQSALQLAQAFDADKGGLVSGHTNKFPPSLAMKLMLRAYQRMQEQGQAADILLDRATVTLDQMARGGIYDHISGGIARYSTDRDWFVPHFEKMLYDQALVSDIFREAYQLTREPHYADVARGILDYVLQDLQSPDGGFYSSRDADSEGVEGRYYVWTREEVFRQLDDADARLFCDYYNISEQGNWEGKNILHITNDVDAVARQHGVSEEEARSRLASARARLLDVRSQRVPPGLDDKILASWNGLMISSLAGASRVLGDEKYREAAERSAGFILDRMMIDGRLQRSYRAGVAEVGGFLDDYTFMIAGLLDLYEATFDVKWIEQARRLNDIVLKHFRDEASGAFYFAADDAEALFVRQMNWRDGPIPSGNAMALINLLRLSVLLDDQDLQSHADALIQSASGVVGESPYGHEQFLCGLDFAHGPTREIIIAGPKDHETVNTMTQQIFSGFQPRKIVMLKEPNQQAVDWDATLPRTQGKTPVDGQPAAYVCEGRTCQPPVSTAAELTELLKAAHSSDHDTR